MNKILMNVSSEARHHVKMKANVSIPQAHIHVIVHQQDLLEHFASKILTNVQLRLAMLLIPLVVIIQQVAMRVSVVLAQLANFVKPISIIASANHVLMVAFVSS